MGPRNLVSRYVLAPIERLATRSIMTSGMRPTLIGSVAIFLAASALALFLLDWRLFGLLALVLALPLEGIALRLARLRLQKIAPTAWWRMLLPALSAGALVALGRSLMAEHGWGMVVLAALAVVFLIALKHELGGRSPPGELFLANLPSLVLLMVPFAIPGWWAAGVALLFAYAAASFFWAQYHAHRKPGLSQG
jgi:hypothetical protein